MLGKPITLESGCISRFYCIAMEMWNKKTGPTIPLNKRDRQTGRVNEGKGTRVNGRLRVRNYLTSTQTDKGKDRVAPEDLQPVVIPANARHKAVSAARTRAERDILDVEVLACLQKVFQLK